MRSFRRYVLGAVAGLIVGHAVPGHANGPIPGPGVTQAQLSAMALTIPGKARGCTSVAVDPSTGTASCTFSTPFTTTAPTCYVTVTSGSSGYVYSDPAVTVTLTGVSIALKSATASMTIALGAATIWASTVPAGTTANMTCQQPS